MAVMLLPFGGCGSSYQAMYESELRFEHCYALDESASASLQDKGQCWRDWTQHYAPAQTRDRVEYANARSKALARAPSLPTDEALMEAAPGVVATTNLLVAPAPTSAFAPPPITERGPQASPTLSAASAEPSAVGTQPRSVPHEVECAASCTQAFQSCVGACSGRGCTPCEAALVACAKGCARKK